MQSFLCWELFCGDPGSSRSSVGIFMDFPLYETQRFLLKHVPEQADRMGPAYHESIPFPLMVRAALKES